MSTMRCLGAVLLLLPGGVLAQLAADPCRTLNTVEINRCAEQTLARRDKELNAAYQALLKSLTPEGKANGIDYPGTRRLLQQAQRSWVQFRDNDCRAKYTFNAGGTIRDIAALGCQIEHTELRTKQLRDWIKA